MLANIIDERDEYTYDHSDRVAEYARKIAEHLQLPLSTIDEIEMAGRIHDLGKIGIEDKILLKKSKLTEEEFEKIKKHPEIAYRLLKKLKPYKEGVNYVLYHHERMDGKGYPCGISDKAIPLGARILAVADSYDAMTTDRPYRRALSKAEAIEELRRNAGTQFDPTVVDIFIRLLENDTH
ncbi:MAG: HD-GYP domain-containing protein [Clostridia bacterium]